MSRTHGDRGDPADKLLVLKKKLESAKKENARLRKELNRVAQRIAELEKIASGDVDLEELRQKDVALTCDECKKGAYETMEIPLRDGQKKIFFRCVLCGYRKQSSQAK